MCNLVLRPFVIDYTAITGTLAVDARNCTHSNWGGGICEKDESVTGKGQERSLNFEAKEPYWWVRDKIMER